MATTDDLEVLADWDRNATFAHVLSDITSRVRYMEWSWGFNAPEQLVAPPSGGTLVLDNSDGAFNIGKTGAAFAGLLRPGVLIKAQKINNSGPFVTGGTYRVFLFRVLDIRIAPGAYGARTVTLTLGDWHDELMSEIYDPPLSTNVTTGDALTAAFNTAAVRIPYASSWWIMDASLLGTNTTIYANTNGPNTAGYTTLSYVGDNTDNGQGNTLYAFIEEMCAAEMDGRFYFFPWSSPVRYVFNSRNTLNTLFSSVTTWEIPSSVLLDPGAEYEYAEELCNWLNVTFYPRRVGAAGTELARTASAFRLKPGESRTMTLRYRDPDFPDGTCAATTIIQPVASTDYTANTAQDGSGTDVTSALGVTVTNNTNSADVLVTNSGAVDLFVTLLKLRGTPLTARQPVQVTSVNAQSIYDYGLHRRTFTVAGVSDQELVQQYADARVNRFKTPQSRYKVVSYDFTDDAPAALKSAHYLARSTEPFGDSVASPTFVQISDSAIEDTSTARIMWIAGQTHRIDANARTWNCTWYLEDIQQWLAWRFDYTVGLTTYDGLSILDQTTRLAF